MKLHVEQYFGKWLAHKDVTMPIIDNAKALCLEVNALMARMELDGFIFKVNPNTQSVVGGETLGGFRPQDCGLGAPMSAHKQGLAVDLYDPDNTIDAWIMAHPLLIKEFDLYFEHPIATRFWSHWTIRKPKSGKRIFYP